MSKLDKEMNRFIQEARNRGEQTNKEGEVINPSKETVKKFNKQFTTTKPTDNTNKIFKAWGKTISGLRIKTVATNVKTGQMRDKVIGQMMNKSPNVIKNTGVKTHDGIYSKLDIMMKQGNFKGAREYLKQQEEKYKIK